MFKELKKQKILQLMVLPGIIFMIVFNYIPMYGLIMAFKQYTVVDTISGAPWIGLDNFELFLKDEKFWNVMYNTLKISIYKLAIGFPLPIILAILLNELVNTKLKKFVQTISYLPHFLSWVILGGMVITWLGEDGILNAFFLKIGMLENPIPYMVEPNYYVSIAVLSDIWKSIGWNSVIYLAAITGIDPTLYEAANIDGANKIQQIMQITLPSIKGIIIMLLVLSISGVLGSNFDQTMILQNSMNSNVSEVIDVYVYKLGIGGGDFSFATAVGLFRSVISTILLLSANLITRKLNDRTLF
ncbi:MAG: ABC transporter permease [Cetobacterium sp.]